MPVALLPSRGGEKGEIALFLPARFSCVNIDDADRSVCSTLLNGDAQIPQQAVSHVVDPAMDDEALAARPRVANDGGLADVHHLLHDVQLAQPPMLLGLGG